MILLVSFLAFCVTLAVVFTTDRLVARADRIRHNRERIRTLIARIIRERVWAESCRRVFRSPTPCKLHK